MDEKGNALMEIMLSISIFSTVLIPMLSIYHQLSAEVAEASKRSHAYWQLYEIVERWKKDMEIWEGAPPEGVQVTVSEKFISPAVQEGEFRMTWRSEKGNQELMVWAYKKMDTPF